MTIIHKEADINLSLKEIKETDQGWSFEGYGAVFGIKDSYDDIIVAGAFKNSLGKWNEKQSFPALLWQHKPDEPIGYYTDMKEDEKGLFVKGHLLPDVQRAKEAYSLIKSGAVSGLSIGYRIEEYTYNEDEQTFYLTEIDLRETSIVTFPANEEALVSRVKQRKAKEQMLSPREVEAILRDAGMSRKQAKSLIARGYQGISERDADDLLESLHKLEQTIRS